MSDFVTDTHAIVWFLFNNPKLSNAASLAFDSVAASGRLIWVPSICLVEVTYLTERNRLPRARVARLNDVLDDPLSLFEIASLDRLVGDTVAKVPGDIVPDMPDRIIAATAIALGLPLIMADARIRRLPISTVW